MSFIRHEFTKKIIEIIEKHYDKLGVLILESSELLQYLNIKTKAANRGSKSRAGFANHYAIYVLVEDYINKDFYLTGNYENYEGAKFTDLLRRQRELPFGSKLQNHALNHRLNEEFKRYFPISEHLPIIRDITTNRYWINENLLVITIEKQKFNIAVIVQEIIDKYIQSRQSAFFMQYCEDIIKIQENQPETMEKFIRDLLNPNTDARIFEIVSYAILKEYYQEQQIYWGWSLNELNLENLLLYKTGRTNANDGGIDFVMKPLGRFFQVTETIDFSKYFLDIDKVQRYPITFIIKTQQSAEDVLKHIREQAENRYRVKAIVNRYMDAVEEIINIPELIKRFDLVLAQKSGEAVIQEIVLQSRLEFNVEATP